MKDPIREYWRNRVAVLLRDYVDPYKLAAQYPLTPDECYLIEEDFNKVVNDNFWDLIDHTIKVRKDQFAEVETSLIDLYYKVYPNADGYEVHQFFSCFALEIKEEEQLARKILMGILNDEDKVVIKSNN